MAKFLINLVRAWKLNQSRHYPADWIDTSKWPIRGGDYHKLTFWDLIEAKPKNSFPAAGFFRPTNKGVEFVEEKTRVNKYVYTFQGVCYGFAPPLIDLQDCFSDWREYRELTQALF